MSFLWYIVHVECYYPSDYQMHVRYFFSVEYQITIPWEYVPETQQMPPLYIILIQVMLSAQKQIQV